MMGEAHGRTIITWRKVVKKLYFASAFSAIRTRSEAQLKTANGELERAIAKFNAHLLSFSVTTPVPRLVAI
jgi:hypothetical protein